MLLTCGQLVCPGSREQHVEPVHSAVTCAVLPNYKLLKGGGPALLIECLSVN